MEKTYTVMIDGVVRGFPQGYITINEEGANVIWRAYASQYGEGQSLDKIEERGGFWLSEIEELIRLKALEASFAVGDYQIEKGAEDIPTIEELNAERDKNIAKIVEAAVSERIDMEEAKGRFAHVLEVNMDRHEKLDEMKKKEGV